MKEIIKSEPKYKIESSKIIEKSMKPKANSMKRINKSDTALVSLISKKLEKTQINNIEGERWNINNHSCFSCGQK